MGKIIVSENVTLDGVIQDPTGTDDFRFSGWFNQLAGKDREAWANAELEEALGSEAMLLGRRSYDWFVAIGWATREGAWANRLRGLPKYVVSSTVGDTTWDNTTVLTGDAVKSVSALKHDVPGDIVVYGSGQLVHTLLEHELVDELRLMICPFVLGEGQRLFDQAGDHTCLRLADTRVVGANIVRLTYQRG